MTRDLLLLVARRWGWGDLVSTHLHRRAMARLAHAVNGRQG